MHLMLTLKPLLLTLALLTSPALAQQVAVNPWMQYLPQSTYTVPLFVPTLHSPPPQQPRKPYIMRRIIMEDADKNI